MRSSALQEDLPASSKTWTRSTGSRIQRTLLSYQPFSRNLEDAPTTDSVDVEMAGCACVDPISSSESSDTSHSCEFIRTKGSADHL